jgi:hypothetical protein
MVKLAPEFDPDAPPFDPTRPVVAQYRELLTGFVGGARGAPKAQQLSWGRPADVLQLPDGSMLISDDVAHTVYRMYHVGANASQATRFGILNEAGEANGGAALGGRAGARVMLLVGAILALAVLGA